MKRSLHNNPHLYKLRCEIETNIKGVSKSIDGFCLGEPKGVGKEKKKKNLKLENLHALVSLSPEVCQGLAERPKQVDHHQN